MTAAALALAAALAAAPNATTAEVKTADGKPGDAAAAEKKELDLTKMTFEPESIKTVIKFHMPEITECYDRVLAETGKKVEGRVVLAFTINPEGMVSEAKVVAKKSTVKNEQIESCVLAVRGWLFPKPPDNRDYPIEYPFELKVAR